MVNQKYHIIADGITRELEEVLNCSEDKVSIYELESAKYLFKEEIGVVEKRFIDS